MMRALLLVLTMGGVLDAQSAAVNLYNQANAFYHDGQFDRAREGYLQVVDTGVEDARLFYNLGNACFKDGRLGEAILWYERALRLAPRDGDIRANLRFANQVKKDREAEEEDALWHYLSAIFFFPTLDELSVLLFALLLIVFGLAVRRLWRRAPVSAGWLALILCCGGLAVVDGIFLAARIHHRETLVEGIVMVEEGTARGGPDEGQTAVFVVHEGTKVRIVRREGDWLLVRLANGLGGWLPEEAIEAI